MAQERLAPDALLEQTNLSGTVADIDDDPDSPDGAWLTAPGSNNNTTARVSFPLPSGVPTIGTGLQEFRVLVRKTNHSTNPTCDVELYESGVLVATLINDQAISSTSGVVLSGAWNANLLTGSDGGNVECRVTGTVGGGSLEVGAVEWNAEIDTAAPSGSGVPALTLGASGEGRTVQNGFAIAALTLVLAGVGTTIHSGNGTTVLVLQASGQGQTVHTGSGTAGLFLDAQGEGTVPVPFGDGAASIVLGASGEGETVHSGLGTLALSLSASGVGDTVHSGSGSLALVLGAQGEGDTLHSGSGTSPLVLTLQGEGSNSSYSPPPPLTLSVVVTIPSVKNFTVWVDDFGLR